MVIIPILIENKVENNVPHELQYPKYVDVYFDNNGKLDVDGTKRALKDKDISISTIIAILNDYKNTERCRCDLYRLR